MSVYDDLKKIPFGQGEGWTRYDTDNQHVLSVWDGKGMTWDVRVPKAEVSMAVDAHDDVKPKGPKTTRALTVDKIPAITADGSIRNERVFVDVPDEGSGSQAIIDELAPHYERR